MRKQTVVSSLTIVELALGRMPISTRRSRASAFQIISARLSENGTMVTFSTLASFRASPILRQLQLSHPEFSSLLASAPQRLTHLAFEAHPRATTFRPSSTLDRRLSSSDGPPASASTFPMPTITGGYARTEQCTDLSPSPHVSLTVHCAVSLLRDSTTGW